MEKNWHDKVILIDSCRNCGRVLKEEWKFCPYCRTQVETCNCPFCREEIKFQWEFCPHCKKVVKNANLNKQTFNEGNEWLRKLLKNE